MVLHLVSGDDWEGLYIDWKLVIQAHSVELFAVLEELEKRRKAVTAFVGVRLEDEELAQLHDVGCLPQSYGDKWWDE